MATVQRTKHSFSEDAALDLNLSAQELTAEGRLGAALARALIEHLSRMRAAGYHNEIVVDGELWTVEVKRSLQAN
jgi:hypothetical protein